MVNIRKDTLVPNCRITYPERRDLQAILLIANKKVWIIKFFKKMVAQVAIAQFLDFLFIILFSR